MPTKIRKAVFPVAGLGTRFLPATKAVPKEMLTLVDKPALQYVVEEAHAAGIEHFVFVTGRNKQVIEDHFDMAFELEATLRERGKTAELKSLDDERPSPGRASFTRQQSPDGLGHAVWCARDIVGNEPFAVLLPDMVKKSEPGCLAQMMEAYNQSGGNIIAVEEVPWDQVDKYGVVGVGRESESSFEITAMVEKPPRDSAPSNLFISGRYILQPEIFDILGSQARGAGNEVQLTDAMIRLSEHQGFTGVRYEGLAFDCGSKAGFLAANLVFALERPDIAAALREELDRLRGSSDQFDLVKKIRDLVG